MTVLAKRVRGAPPQAPLGPSSRVGVLLCGACAASARSWLRTHGCPPTGRFPAASRTQATCGGALGWRFAAERSREAFLLPGQGTPVVMVVARGDRQAALRYPPPFAEEHFVEGLRVGAPTGKGLEARALHERLLGLAEPAVRVVEGLCAETGTREDEVLRVTVLGDRGVFAKLMARDKALRVFNR